MKADRLIEQVEDLVKKIKKQDIEFGLYLEDNLILDKENGAIYYFGQKLTDLDHLPIIVGD